MAEKPQAPAFIEGLYENLIEEGLHYFFSSATFQSLANTHVASGDGVTVEADGTSILIDWLGSRCSLERNEPFADSEVKLVRSIGAVLASRYRIVLDTRRAQRRFDVFRGLSEDRYVSAFLDCGPYDDPEWNGQDRLEDAIEVLRTTSLSTYENRRISTGALLVGKSSDPCHQLPSRPLNPLRYSPPLTSIRSFYRLCDGLQTLALVDEDGFLAEIVDVEQWAEPYSDIPLPVPSAAKYRAHSRATLCGGHTCMILTPNGGMKIIAEGAQVFRFWDGRWKLTDGQRKHGLWASAIHNAELAERLFVAALNLAEERRGGLLVVLDDPRTVRNLVRSTDLLASLPDCGQDPVAGTKDQLHYLLHGKRMLDIPVSVLETIARIDGGIVLDQDSNLLAFGAILRHHELTDLHPQNIEGGRTTAAIAASRFGNVLKVSEDGLISFFQKGKCIWDI